MPRMDPSQSQDETRPSDVATAIKKAKAKSPKSFVLPFSATETLPTASPNKHNEMSCEMKFPINITTDLGDNLDDPAHAVGLFYSTIFGVCYSLILL